MVWLCLVPGCSSTASGWPISSRDLKCSFPHWDLVISPPRMEGEEENEKNVVDDGWPSPEPSTNPVNVWGSNDCHDPPPLVGISLAT